MENQDSTEHTELADISGNDVQHLLERRFLLFGITKGGLDLAFTGLLADDDDEVGSLSSRQISSGKKYARGDVMVMSSTLGALLMDSLLFHANFERIARQVVRFTGHGRLIDLNTAGLQHNTVDWDTHASLDLDNIANTELVTVDFHPRPVT